MAEVRHVTYSWRVPSELADSYKVDLKVDLGPFPVVAGPIIIQKSQLEPTNAVVAKEPAKVAAAKTYGIIYVVCGLAFSVIVLPLCYLKVKRRKRSTDQ